MTRRAPDPWSEDRAIERFKADTRKCLRVALRCASDPSDRAHLKIIVAADEGRVEDVDPKRLPRVR